MHSSVCPVSEEPGEGLPCCQPQCVWQGVHSACLQPRARRQRSKAAAAQQGRVARWGWAGAVLSRAQGFSSGKTLR